MLLEEQLALETRMVRPPLSLERKLLPPPASHSRPGMLCATGGPGDHATTKLQRSVKSEYLVVCISVKGGKLSA